MTRSLYAFIGLAVALSLGHHVDHVLRGATGWPLTDTANPFTYSLLVYPAIVAGLALSRRGRAGPRFWLLLSSAGAVFVLAVHVGPTADDSLAGIAAGYSSPVAAVAALACSASSSRRYWASRSTSSGCGGAGAVARSPNSRRTNL